MSKLRIKLKLPPSEESPATNTNNKHDNAAAAAISPLSPPALAPKEGVEQRGDDEDEDEEEEEDFQEDLALSSGADGQTHHPRTYDADTADVSMANSNAADSEDELASGDEDDDQDSNGPSSSAAEAGSGQHLRRRLGSSSSRTASPFTSSGQSRGKRKPTIKDEVGHMTAEELDALPPAKRRKGAKARGAPGPGRGWRKGLKMGQKPVYALPDPTPIAEGTPSTMVSDFNRASPGSAFSPSPMRSTSIAVMAPSASSSSTKTAKAHSNAAIVSAAPAAAAAASAAASSPQPNLQQKQPLIPGRPSQAIAAALAFGPPVKQPPRLINTLGPTSSATGASSEILSLSPYQKPRRWYHEEREFVNLAGRVIKVKTWWGGKDESFHPAQLQEEIARAQAAMADAAAAPTKGRSTADADDSTTGSPVAYKTSNPRPSANTVLQAATAALMATKGGTEQVTKASAGKAKFGNGSASGGAAFFSPSLVGKSGKSGDQSASPTSSTVSPSSHAHLPQPKFRPGGGSDWKVSSAGKSSAAAAASSKK